MNREKVYFLEPDMLLVCLVTRKDKLKRKAFEIEKRWTVYLNYDREKLISESRTRKNKNNIYTQAKMKWNYKVNISPLYLVCKLLFSFACKSKNFL